MAPPARPQPARPLRSSVAAIRAGAPKGERGWGQLLSRAVRSTSNNMLSARPSTIITQTERSLASLIARWCDDLEDYERVGLCINPDRGLSTESRNGI